MHKIERWTKLLLEVTTDNTTTVGLSNTRSEVEYESDKSVNRATAPNSMMQ